MQNSVDLLCVGIACYDLIFQVDHHPEPDEKTGAYGFMQCGGGTAANAAVAAARLGHRVAYAGYLGNDLYGQRHVDELEAEGVDTQLVVRGDAATSLSAILVKPDGRRTIVNYKEEVLLQPDSLDLSQWQARAVLFDGHHHEYALTVADWAEEHAIPTVIDADRAHTGSVALAARVDYLVASERFADEYTHEQDPEKAALALLDLAPNVIITLGERGLIWRNRQQGGRFPAFVVDAIDTTGAGDAFHGAFAAGVAAGYEWDHLLSYASATGALCTTVTGARTGMPSREAVMALLAGG
jgi:sulfofructose kinase